MHRSERQHRARYRGLLAAGLALFALTAAACSSDSDGGTTTTAAPSGDTTSGTTDPTTGDTMAATTSTTEGAGPMLMVLQGSPLTATLDSTYGTPELFPAGSVTVEWYQADGRYVALFTGLDLEATGPVCPGGSLSSAAGFEHVANAPTEEGECSAFGTLDPAATAQVCGSAVLFHSLIPVDGEGVLFGTVEVSEDGAAFRGGTSQTPADGALAPEIALDSPGYFLPDGSEAVC